MSEKDISEIKESLGKIWDVLRDLQLDVAKCYVTKDDLDKFKKENETAHTALAKGKVPAWMAIVFPIVSGAFMWLLARAFPTATQVIQK